MTPLGEAELEKTGIGRSPSSWVWLKWFHGIKRWGFQPGSKGLESKRKSWSRYLCSRRSGQDGDELHHPLHVFIADSLRHSATDTWKSSLGPVISFGTWDMEGIYVPHNDALVIQSKIANYDVMWVYVDSRSLVNIIFLKNFDQMDLKSYKLEPVETAFFSNPNYILKLSQTPKWIFNSMNLRSKSNFKSNFDFKSYFL